MDNYDYSSNGGDAGAVGLIFAFLGLYAVLGIAWYVFFGIAGSRLFKKMGYANPWAAWVPLYNTYALLEVGKQKGWWIFVFLGASFLNIIPVIGSILYMAAAVLLGIASIYAYININKGFQKDTTTWTIFAALLNPIWLGILAFGDSNQYRDDLANGPYFLNKEATNAGQYANQGYAQPQQAPYGQPQAPYGQATQAPVAPQNPYGQPPVAPQNPYGQQPPANPYGLPPKQ